jgi:hypothetical protein
MEIEGTRPTSGHALGGGSSSSSRQISRGAGPGAAVRAHPRQGSLRLRELATMSSIDRSRGPCGSQEDFERVNSSPHSGHLNGQRSLSWYIGLLLARGRSMSPTVLARHSVREHGSAGCILRTQAAIAEAERSRSRDKKGAPHAMKGPSKMMSSMRKRIPEQREQLVAQMTHAQTKSRSTGVW